MKLFKRIRTYAIPVVERGDLRVSGVDNTTAVRITHGIKPSMREPRKMLLTRAEAKDLHDMLDVWLKGAN